MYPSNYRPISILSIHSKILERVISSQLITYLTINKIPNIFQSAYLPHKSTESALTLITSDILSGLNNNRGTILVLLDMSSAFDTLDHNILIHRISAIGITGIPSTGSPPTLPTALPQSGLILFPLPLHNPRCPPGICPRPTPLQYLPPPHVWHLHWLPRHLLPYLCRRPSTIYLNCTVSPTYAPDRLSSCIKSIHQWLTSNSLKLNLTKMEAIFSIYPYAPPPYLNHPHLTRQHLTTLL